MMIRRINTTLWCGLLLAFILSASASADVMLEKVISREHPLFQNRGKFLNVGRDGKVYVGAGSYLVRMNRDGSGKIGVQMGRGQQAVATDANGNFALADSPHRGRQVLFCNSAFEPLGAVGGFLSDKHLNWGSPCDVQSGESGDFYAIDQHRNRILRIALPGKIVAEYSLQSTGEDFVDTEPFFRVVESLQRFYIAGRNCIHAIGFDGRMAWTIDLPLVALHDAFDADDEGNLYVLRGETNAVTTYGSDGKPRKAITLQMADLAHGRRQQEYASLELFGDEILLKRHRDAHPTEIFRVYDRSGALQRVVQIDAESVKAEFPSTIWTAGEPVPVTVTLKSGTKTSHPHWPVQIALCNHPRWIDLPVVNGQVTPPADAAGLYAMRIGYGDFKLEEMVEIRRPGSLGTINILSPRNRVYYGRGEEIPIAIAVRGPQQDRVKLELRQDSNLVWSTEVNLLSGKAADLLLPAEFTAALSPGEYLLTTEAKSLTVASQPIIIGPGLQERPIFNIVQGGDGGGVMTVGNGYEAPEAVNAYIRKANRIGANMVMSRAGYLNLNAPTGFEAVAKRLANDPLGIAPEKAWVENVAEQTIAAHGAFGIEQQMILLHMDTLLPLLPEGKPSPGGMYSRTHLSEQRHVIDSVSKQLLPYPAFRGWSWACNWWIHPEDALGTEGLAGWKKLLKQVRRTHQWQDNVIPVSDRLISLIPETDKAFNNVLQYSAPGKLHAATGPYRQPWVIPPISFRNVDEVDLFLQSEQIPPPYVTPHNVDFYKRLGKRAFARAETGTEDGTGDMGPAVILLQAMRGVDGTGWEGKPPFGRPTGRRGTSTSGMDNDVRSTGQGVVSVFRALGNILRNYGPWLTTLVGNDKIAIVVSTRMMRIDEWGSGVVGAGEYFNRLFEAYTTCLFAHRPAVFVFTEDLPSGALDKFKAVLIVDQQLELDPPLAAALQGARDAGVRVFFDGTCRSEFVGGFEPLNVTFDRLEQDVHLMNDDAVYWRLPRVYRKQVEALTKTLGDVVPPVAGLDSAEIAVSERRSGEGRFVWVVNNDYPDWEPGVFWRVGNFITTRVGQQTPIDLNATGQTTYELFGWKEVQGEAIADLRQMPARLFAVLPKPIKSIDLSAPDQVKAGNSISWKVTVDGPKTSYPLRICLSDSTGAVIQELFPTKAEGTIVVPRNTTATMMLEATELISGKQAKRSIEVTGVSPQTKLQASSHAAVLPVEKSFGPHLRDLALSTDGQTALINAMNWDDNYFLLDAESGVVRSQGSVGHQFAYGPVAAGKGFFLQGYDVGTAEGYHLYDLGADGKPSRRFANYGLPDRWMGWRGMGILTDRINNFAISPSGSWVASAGNLGLIVWSKDGRKLWSHDWWHEKRQEMFLLASGEETLITLTGMTVTAYQATTGKQRWEVQLAESGYFEGGSASADGRTLAVYAHTAGGRVLVLRDGKLINTLPVLADNVYLTPDGRSLLMLVGGDQLRWYSANGGLQWDFRGDDYLIGPRISPDGAKICVGSQIGTLTVLDRDGKRLWERDFGSLPMATWLHGGELLVATWMGDVIRLDALGNEKWRVKLAPKSESRLATSPSAELLTTIKPAWGNAAEKAAPLAPNLLAADNVVIRLTAAQPPAREFSLQHPASILTDGRPEPLATPWIDWTLLNSLDFFKVALEIDAGRRIRVAAVTFLEDPAHPESWLRDMRLQVWDDDKRDWKDGPYLASDTAVHTHRFAMPVDGSKFRFKGTGKMDQEWRWPMGNIRLGEIVFHGSTLEQK